MFGANNCPVNDHLRIFQFEHMMFVDIRGHWVDRFGADRHSDKAPIDMFLTDVIVLELTDEVRRTFNIGVIRSFKRYLMQYLKGP